MKNVVTGKVGSAVALTSAILLYEGANGACYATVHPVGRQGRTGRTVIGAGRPVTRDALVASLRALDENTAARVMPFS